MEVWSRVEYKNAMLKGFRGLEVHVRYVDGPDVKMQYGRYR